MATGNIGVTQVDAFIPEVWSKEIIYQTTNKSIFGNLVRRDFDDEVAMSGDTVHVPIFSAVTIGDKTENTAVDYTNYSETTKDITIDKHKTFAFRVDDIARVQSSPDLIAGYTEQGGRGMAKQIDTDVAANIIDADITQNVGLITTGAYTDITDVLFRAGIQLLDEAEAPDEDRFLVISPAQKNALLGIKDFVTADKIGDPSVIRKGLFGEVYGVRIYISNNLPDVAAVASSSGGAAVPAYKACPLFQKEAFALVMQLNPRVNAAWDIDYIATSVVGDALYGTDNLRPLFAVQMRLTTEV